MKIGDFSVEMFPIKSKFHENKDWNYEDRGLQRRDVPHQEQVPRKQGLKRQMQEPMQKIVVNIKSKFHENKDWNFDPKIL